MKSSGLFVPTVEKSYLGRYEPRKLLYPTIDNGTSRETDG